MNFRTVLSAAIIISAAFHAQGSKEFLGFDKSKPHRFINNKAFQEDIINAMGPMLGCGGQASSQKVAAVQKTLEPMWRTLPKSYDRIDRRSLRYLVHRYFMQTSSLMIRGFEPSRPVNESHWGAADILSQMVPAFVESVLESGHAKSNGFSLKDAVNMVVMLDQLIYDSESTLLEKVYKNQRKPTQKTLSHNGLSQVLEAYMVEWMVEGDEEDMQMLLENRSLMIEVVPHFEQLVQFAQGRAKALQFARQRQTPKGQGRNTWEMKYSFEDAHAIVAGITQNFQTYWQSECESMKSALISMDTHHTGRVPISVFYHSAINSDWRFGESESYLRELGALDESSSHTGIQVIIPNYIQATSNCIVSTPHYLVCCQNECEQILGEIEVALQSPTASPTEILEVVGNMSLQTTIDEEETPQLDGALTEQLEQIAKAQGGMVPLHGRLFAQWLHYVFPRECPFPHKIGMVSAVTPTQYGEEYVASETDMKKHAANATKATIPISVNKEELQWMSQWSPDEEFIVDYSSELGMSWETRMFLGLAGVILLIFGVTGGAVTFNRKAAFRGGQKCYV